MRPSMDAVRQNICCWNLWLPIVFIMDYSSYYSWQVFGRQHCLELRWCLDLVMYLTALCPLPRICTFWGKTVSKYPDSNIVKTDFESISIKGSYNAFVDIVCKHKKVPAESYGITPETIDLLIDINSRKSKASDYIMSDFMDENDLKNSYKKIRSCSKFYKYGLSEDDCFQVKKGVCFYIWWYTRLQALQHRLLSFGNAF